MAKAKGIHANPFLKLGKAPVKKDRRNFKFMALLRKKVAVPAAYDFDRVHAGVPTPMFANDTYGDCVLAGRAHQTLRFELLEQHKLIKISDKDVTSEYFKESGGADSGLVVLDSLNEWRSDGWKAGGRRYKIKAFAQLDPQAPAEIKQAIFLDVGAGIGLRLPKSAKHQMDTGQVWDVVPGKDSKPGSWGGHYVLLTGYTKSGPVCITWGQKKAMTWRFLEKYCDEAYAIFDARDARALAKLNKTIDVPHLNSMLKAL